MVSKTAITKDRLERYYDLSRLKKEIEEEMNQIKEEFHAYFDAEVGANKKGEIIEGNYKLLRQVRKTEKYNDSVTVQRLEELNMTDLIQVVKKADGDRIDAAINLGLLKEEDLDGCKKVTYSKAILIKEI